MPRVAFADYTQLAPPSCHPSTILPGGSISGRGSTLPKTPVGKIDYKALVAEHVAPRQPVTHGGDRVAATLQAHGVRLVFTLCGGHISPILVGAKARGLRVVDVRDEATSVFAADAVARLTGAPGVAAVTAGPGVTNMLTALKNAQLAQSPVVGRTPKHSHTPKVGAACGNSARAVLCGGRPVTAVPTANV